MLGFVLATAMALQGVANAELIRIDEDVVVDTEPGAVWQLLTTPEGLRDWIAPESRVELKLRGAYELYFFPDSTDRGMEGTEVLSYVPEEMLSYTGELPDTWVVWRLEPVADRRTRVSFTALGRGPDWREASIYFREAMPDVMERLRDAADAAGGG